MLVLLIINIRCFDIDIHGLQLSPLYGKETLSIESYAILHIS